jgi:hypothetical protein
MVSFQTKNPNLGKFWRALDWKIFIYFKAIWNILQTFGLFYDHLVHFAFTWYIFPRFGIFYQEKSGNPGCRSRQDEEDVDEIKKNDRDPAAGTDPANKIYTCKLVNWLMNEIY